MKNWINKHSNKPIINKNIKRYKNIWYWIIVLAIIEIPLLLNVHMSSYEWWESVVKALIPSIIIIVLLAIILNKVNKWKKAESNPTNNKKTSIILCILRYLAVLLIRYYFWI